MNAVPVVQVLVVAILVGGGSLAFGNPSMLPPHPGYPMGNAVDPVRGQSLANDSGRKNLYGEKALAKAAVADVDPVTQGPPANRQDTPILKKQGDGIQPKVEGSAIKHEPPTKKRRR